MRYYYDKFSTPIGSLLIIKREDNYLSEILFHSETLPEAYMKSEDGYELNPAKVADVKMQLEEYFAGIRSTFEGNLAPKGTEFQSRVWRSLQTIPYGETRSYLDIAKSIGNPKACRAVGMANGKNPIPIIIPCHRVIGSNGALTGFAGGIDVKIKLLELESKK